MKKTLYKNVLLKISGEILAGNDTFGVNDKVLNQLSKEINQIKKLDIDLSIVIGGGNFYRGENFQHSKINKNDADHIGMIATVMNGIFLKNALRNYGVKSIIYSAFSIDGIIDVYNYEKAKDMLSKGYVIILVGGTGNPHFTTDTASVLRAVELDCDIVLKGTKVDGVYDKDPLVHTETKKFTKLNYNYIISNKLKVMDITAIALAEENSLPILVFSIKKEGELKEVLYGKGNYTLIK
tara:strand:+ start:14366 stop:15079 length:714 start_codon:yes stop_codon:yes gene_type:complete